MPASFRLANAADLPRWHVRSACGLGVAIGFSATPRQETGPGRFLADRTNAALYVSIAVNYAMMSGLSRELNRTSWLRLTRVQLGRAMVAIQGGQP